MPNLVFEVPRSQGDQTVKYERFKGADFTTDPTQIDRSRSPWPKNLISDTGGYPEKRPGWKTVTQFAAEGETLPAVNGIFRLEADGEEHFLAHVGTKVFRWFPDESTPVLLKSGLTNDVGMGAAFGGRLWILTGGEFLVYGEFDAVVEGETVQTWQLLAVEDIAYVPTLFINRDPAGGGVAFDAVNLLQAKRKDSFLADGTATVYQLSGTGIDAAAVSAVVNGTAMAEGAGLTVNRTTGAVTFSAAPLAPEAAGGVAGADNVVIAYSKTVSGYADKIKKCRILTMFGVGTADRMFFSGNPDSRNLDWHSEWGDPSYVPDISYAVIGGEETAVMGYLHIGDALGIVKEDNQQDATVFLRTALITDDGETVFAVRQGVQSVGAVSRGCFASFRDNPLFLSRSGVHAVATVTVTLERTVRRRSQWVDAKLTREPNLEEAAAAVWNDLYVLCVNNHCYVADSRQNSQDGLDGAGYEWYYWEGVPARRFMEFGGTLAFGTADGRICSFRDDDGMERFMDDDAAIVAEWATLADDDGDFMRLKTMTRRGSGVMLKPYTQSSVKVIALTEKDFGTVIRTAATNIFDFSALDFENFSFNTLEGPQVIPFNKKIKKYRSLQIVVRNDAELQGFGVYGIIKRIRYGGYVKR